MNKIVSNQEIEFVSRLADPTTFYLTFTSRRRLRCFVLVVIDVSPVPWIKTA